MSVLASVALAVSMAGAVADIESMIERRLEGGAPCAVRVQQAIAGALAWSARSPRGVAVRGPGAAVRDVDPAALHGELGEPAAVLHCIEAGGIGPEPLAVIAPLPPDAGGVEVFRRAEEGLFLRIAEGVERRPGRVSFAMRFPGLFVVRKAAAAPAAKRILPEYPAPSADPALKAAWRFFRVGADEIAGPAPLVLVHGLGTDRWADFTHWARFSPEAEAFRAEFQVWNFSHPMAGINAAVGYDPACPLFEESIAAYLHRMIAAAQSEGVETEGLRHFFPAGPFAMLTSSHGALKARAFLVNFPEWGARAFAVLTLGGPHTGTPLGNPEWVRYTADRVGLFKPGFAERIVDFGFRVNYFSSRNQADLDVGWTNLDAAGGWGMPYVDFTAWSRADRRSPRVLSPRDANAAGARALPGFERDASFEPAAPLETECGTLDLILPRDRGGLLTDRLILYASYIERGADWRALIDSANDGMQPAPKNLIENSGLRVAERLFGWFESAGGDWPASPYAVGDGLVPLQSQLMLDGAETERVYETETRLGWTVPVRPIRPNWDAIREHTLADPDKIRIWPGWSHLDTVTGRYNRRTGHSPFFSAIAQDLIAAKPD